MYVASTRGAAQRSSPQIQLQLHMQHDVSKVLLLLHRILTHLKDPHISLTDNPNLEEFSVVLEQIQSMLPRAMHGGVDGGQVGSPARSGCKSGARSKTGKDARQVRLVSCVSVIRPTHSLPAIDSTQTNQDALCDAGPSTPIMPSKRIPLPSPEQKQKRKRLWKIM